MKLLDLLRKMGTFRFGFVKAKYKNAKQRPIELQQSDIFNAKKDMISKKKKRKR
jgi:hypothetical protein